jgi:hypothetical protein
MFSSFKPKKPKTKKPKTPKKEKKPKEVVGCDPRDLGPYGLVEYAGKCKKGYLDGSTGRLEKKGNSCVRECTGPGGRLLSGYVVTCNCKPRKPCFYSIKVRVKAMRKFESMRTDHYLKNSDFLKQFFKILSYFCQEPNNI